VTEPGVLHIEAHLSEGAGVVIYDSNVITSEKFMPLFAERAKSWPATIQADFPVTTAR